jgi:hypothetical protein
LRAEKQGSLEKALSQYADAHGHISNLGPDAHQYIAGVMLERLTSHIEQAGFFGETGTAKSQLSVAIDHYTHGRTLRTGEPEQSMEQFHQCISICKEAMLGISLPTKKEVVRFWTGVIGGGGVIGTIVIVLKILDVL